MEQRTVDDLTLTQYLLGLLSEDERTHVERSFFQSDESFDQLTTLEDELIDDYARGRLSAQFRSAFEEKLKTNPRWKQRLVFARALSRQFPASSADRIQPERSSIWKNLSHLFGSFRPSFQLAFAAGGALAIFAAAWLGWQVREQRTQLQALEGERRTLENAVGSLKDQVAGLEQRGQDLNRQLDEQRRQHPDPASQQQTSGGTLRLLASIVLSPGLVRGNADLVQVKVPGSPGTVRLQLDLATVGEYRSYRAELRSGAGNLIWNKDMLGMRTVDWGKAVFIDLPSSVLQNGEYELSLQGLMDGGKFDDPAIYYFNVVKQP